MKYLLIISLLICLKTLSTNAQTVDDTLAIKETVLNYIEGWYSGNADRMNNALHPELSKRGIIPSRIGTGTELINATYSEMLNWTKNNPNNLEKHPAIKKSISIKIIEIGVNIANVKCVSKEFIDYLHLSKLDGEWKILNAIWEPNYKSLSR